MKGHRNHVLAHPDQSGNLVTDCAGYVVSVVHVSDILLLVNAKDPLCLGVDMLKLLPDFISQNGVIAKRFGKHVVVLISGGTKQRVTCFI